MGLQSLKARLGRADRLLTIKATRFFRGASKVTGFVVPQPRAIDPMHQSLLDGVLTELSAVLETSLSGDNYHQTIKQFGRAQDGKLEVTLNDGQTILFPGYAIAYNSFIDQGQAVSLFNRDIAYKVLQDDIAANDLPKPSDNLVA